jgi:hypothetical protein
VLGLLSSISQPEQLPAEQGVPTYRQMEPPT